MEQSKRHRLEILLLMILAVTGAMLVGIPVFNVGGGGVGALGPVCQGSTISGSVFIDFNNNGVREALEPAREGVSVTAYDSSNTAVAATTTDQSGIYAFTGLAGEYRIEFSDLGNGFFPGPKGSGSETTVVFTSSGDCAVNLGLSSPTEYCDPNPKVATSVFNAGNPLAAGSSANAPAIVSYNYLDTGDRELPFGPPGYVPPETIAPNSEVGTVWGLAYQKSTQTLYSSTVARRHAGTGPGTRSDSIGAIYITDLSGPTPLSEGYINLADLGIPTGVDPRGGNNSGLSPNNTDPSLDLSIYDKIGRVGIGDIEFSEDEKTLWLVNLFDKNLYGIQIGLEGVTPGPGSVIVNQLIPNNAHCNGKGYRPWGLKVHQGDVYVGVVCSAEESQDASDLWAYIVKFDGSSFSTFFDFPLSYKKGYALKLSSGPLPNEGKYFHPWPRSYTDIHSQFVEPNSPPYWLIYPTPVFSSIDIMRDGSLVVGFMDLSGLLYGRRNLTPTGTNKTVSENGGGEILRICPDPVSGALTLENNGECGNNVTAGSGNDQGPGGGEYFFQDFLQLGAGENVHQELSLGANFHLPGSDEIMALTYDASGDTISAGQRTYSLTGGTGIRWYDVYDSKMDNGTFGKAVGLGDIEALCSPAPIEIGNRVFKDSNDNGVQDANELGISGVTVRLYQGATLVASQITSSLGEYYFVESNGVVPLTNYRIRLDLASDYSSGGPLFGLTLASVNSGDDVHDSDGATISGFPEITLMTGVGGENNHTFDFGFKAVATPTPTPSPSASPSPSSSPSPSPSASPSPSPSASPSSSPSPSPSTSPSPSASPSSSPSASPTPSPSASTTPSTSPTPTPQGDCSGTQTNEGCIDCAGVLNGGAQLDRCGVCNGDGMSCLDCAEKNMFETQAVMDGSLKSMEKIARKLTKAAVKCDANLAKKATKLNEAIHSAQIAGWINSWELPTNSTICENLTFCVSNSNQPKIDEYLGNAGKVYKIFKSMAKLHKKACGEFNKKYSDQVEKIYKHAVELANSFPKTQSTCQ